jgi:uncharacterized protein (TIGR03083 family)
VDIPAWITALRADGELLADAAASTSLDATVPGCPGWQARDLVGHIGRVHRWARTMVADRITEDGFGKYGEIMEGLEAPADDKLVDWFRTGHRDLVDTLATAPADLECFTFMAAPTPLTFWARRQAHETAVHRVDAEQAANRPSTVDPGFAADGVDELLTGFLQRSRKPRTAEPRTVLVSSDGRHWLVRFGPDAGATEVDEPQPADTTISGPADTMYLALWNRVPWDGLTVSGADGLPELWAEMFRVR